MIFPVFQREKCINYFCMIPYLHICVILCILLRLRDIGLPFFPYITGCWLIFGVGSLSNN